MTLADAITRARTGESDGFACLFHHTAPNVWLAATVLGCPQIGTAVTQIYRDALTSISSLRSPSDLRVWIGRIAYGVLLAQPDDTGTAMPMLTGDTAEAYDVMAALPRQERTALLLLCGDGCSAPQAAEILSDPDIEIKRAMRRARQTIAAHMKQAGCTASCNTAWLISILAEMRSAQAEQTEQTLAQVLDCVQSGADYMEPQPEELPEQLTEKTESAEEKGGFFQKWFRSKRFG